jgi:hypothetical protein
VADRPLASRINHYRMKFAARQRADFGAFAPRRLLWGYFSSICAEFLTLSKQFHLLWQIRGFKLRDIKRVPAFI